MLVLQGRHWGHWVVYHVCNDTERRERGSREGLSTERALAEEDERVATQLGVTDDVIDVCERSAYGLGKGLELGIEASSIKA